MNEKKVSRWTITDHEGREWESKAAMCKGWGVVYNTFNARMQRSGGDIKFSLTGISDKGPTDFNGVHYKSDADMCRTHHVHKNTYRARLKATGDKKYALVGNQFDDSMGNSFNSVSKLCEFWTVKRTTFLYYWHTKGMPIWDAIQRSTCADHTGKTYKNIWEMFKAWHLSLEDFIKGMRECGDLRCVLEGITA